MFYNIEPELIPWAEVNLSKMLSSGERFPPPLNSHSQISLKSLIP
jgi:hypothetical protein